MNVEEIEAVNEDAPEADDARCRQIPSGDFTRGAPPSAGVAGAEPAARRFDGRNERTARDL